MRRLIFIITCVLCHPSFVFPQDILPSVEKLADVDWLVKPILTKAAVYKSQDGKDIVLYNGLVKRSFRIIPNVVCTEFKNMMNGQQLFLHHSYYCLLLFQVAKTIQPLPVQHTLMNQVQNDENYEKTFDTIVDVQQSMVAKVKRSSSKSTLPTG